ncbi:DUF4150 domain-containing protein [Nannocystis sp. ILAH1]|uniref:PAAR-like domain-containing protein n=1 Tax=unclassified Nannocystis TaxID=2627009 RepID=UPI00226F0D9C|nr:MULTISPECIES: PAAR-like domain-containing protein [unclassified Nannocystis]MCY0991084.1 DUF4150 domain-containing protein [Nannocystis sp. ILAH1]MCY1064597.1 DUF4150 domain-containing protein [Nannocystis sp. RBIL2]
MSSVSVNPPKTPVTDGSSGIAAATIPNVCKMPGPPAPFVPTPLPNIGKSDSSPAGYSKGVTIEGNKVAIKGATFKSMGDVASRGTGGGLVSNNVEGPTSFVGPGSMDVKIEGKNVHLLSDPMLNNGGPSGTPANAATMTGVIQMCGAITSVHGKEMCALCGEEHGKDRELADTPDLRGALRGFYKALPGNVPGATLSNKLRQSTMIGVACCADGVHFVANSNKPRADVRDQATKQGWVHAPGTIDDDAVLEVARKAKNVTPEKWERVISQASWRFDESTKDRTIPSANAPGQCAGTRVIVLLLVSGAVPQALSEIWYSPQGNSTGGKMAHWQEIRPGRQRLTARQFGPGEHVPPCATCAIVLPALMCCVDKKEPCAGHKPRTWP